MVTMVLVCNHCWRPATTRVGEHLASCDSELCAAEIAKSLDRPSFRPLREDERTSEMTFARVESR